MLPVVLMAMQVVGAVNSAIGNYYGARSQRANLRFQADMAEINARQAELGAQAELQRGQHEIAQLTRHAGQVKSSQRAAMAANGIDLGVGSAAEVLASTDIMKEIDRNTLEANAVRSAWGYRMQATDMQNQATLARASAKSISPVGSALTSLLGGAGQVAGSWYMLDKSGAFASPSGGNAGTGFKTTGGTGLKAPSSGWGF